MRKLLAVLAAVLLVVSPLAPFVVISSGSAAPPGFASVPSEQTSEASVTIRSGQPQAGQLPSQAGPPAGVLQKLPKQALDNVAASRHADTLDVQFAATQRGGLAMLLTDDRNPDSRRLAVPASAFEDTMGYRPELAYGLHEDGSQWQRPIDYADGYARFAVPHFSTNTVTFEGEVTCSGTGVTDGTQLCSYDISDLDSASAPNVTLTGVTHSEWDNQTTNQISNGGTFSADVAGNMAPKGSSSNNEPEVVFGGNGFGTRWDNQSFTGQSNGTISYGIDGNQPPTGPSSNGEPQVTFTGVSKLAAIYHDSNDNLKYVTADGTVKDTDEQAQYAGTAGDMDSDGDLDIPFDDDSDGNIKAVDTSGNVIGTGVSTPYGIGGIADFDDDGDGDIIYRDSSSNVKWTDSSGNTGDTGVQADNLGGVGDFDDDGDQDIIYETDGNRNLKYVDSSGNTVTLISDGTAAYPGGAGDIDGDGDLDFTYAKYSTNWVWYVDESGNKVNMSVQAQAVVGGVGDFDGDGDQEASYEKDSNGNIAFVDNSGNVDDTGVDPNTLTGKGKLIKTTDPAVDIDQDGTNEASHSGTLNDGATRTKEIPSLSLSDDNWDISTSAGNVDISANVEEREFTEDPAVDIDQDGTDEATYSGNLSDGQTASKEISSLSLSDDTWDVSTATGSVNITARIQERTETVAPSVEINNGNWLNESGTLSAGTTVEKSGQSSWLQSGTNYVNVSLGTSGITSDAPTMQVDIDTYNHSHEDNISHDYDNQEWSEVYNVSKTYSADQNTANLTIPFASSRVVQARNPEYRINGTGGWATISADNRSLSGTTWEADLDGIYGGTIPASTKFEVRVNGSKVKTANGGIEVLEATAAGNSLNTKLNITSMSTGFDINVGGTRLGENNTVHYTASESWSNVSSYVVIQSDADQFLHVPQASAGDTFRVRNMSTEFTTGGDVRVEIQDAANYEFVVKPGPNGGGDSVTVTYHQTTSGTSYILYSLDDDKGLVDDVAESPVTFSDDDGEDTWTFKTGSLGSSGGSGGGGGALALPSPDEPLGQVGIILMALAGLLAVVFVFAGDDEEPTTTTAGEGAAMSASPIDRAAAAVTWPARFTGTSITDALAAAGNALLWPFRAGSYAIRAVTPDAIERPLTPVARAFTWPFRTLVNTSASTFWETLDLLLWPFKAAGSAIVGFIKMVWNVLTWPFRAAAAALGGLGALIPFVGSGRSEPTSRSRESDSTRDTSDGNGGGLLAMATAPIRGIIGAAGTAGSVILPVGSKAGSAGVGLLRSAVTRALSQRWIQVVIAGFALAAVFLTDAITLGQEERIILIVLGSLVGVYVLLSRMRRFSWPLYAMLVVATVLMALTALGSDVIGSLIESPVFPLAVLAGGFLAWRWLKTVGKDKETTIQIVGRRGGGD